MAVLTPSRPALVQQGALGAERYLPTLVALVGAYALVFSARGWLQFVDESDNFLGGYLIAHGKVLYRDYFSHHMPLPYYLAAVPSIFGVNQLVGFRLFTSLLILAFWSFVVVRFRSRIAPAILSVFILTIGIGFPQFAGNKLLAELIEAYCLLIIALYIYAIPELNLSVADQAVVALAVFGAAMSTLLSFYPLVLLLGYCFYQRYQTRRPTDLLAWLRGEARFAAVLVAPFVAVLALFVATGTLTPFVQDAFTFNQVYYSKYALAGDPVHIVIGLIRDDYHLARTYLPPLGWQTLDGFTLLSNLIAFCVLIRRRGPILALTYAAVVATSRGRGDPFHDQAYYLLSFFAIAAIVVTAAPLLASGVARLRRDGLHVEFIPRLTLAFAALGYLLLAGAFYFDLVRLFPWSYPATDTFNYEKMVQSTTRPGDTIWIAPLDFYGYLASDRMPATSYAFYLPWLADSPTINAGILRDLDTSRPPVIIYPQGLSLARVEAGKLQIYPLDQYGEALHQKLLASYVVADESDPVLRNVLLRKDRADELRQRLRAAGAYSSGARNQ